MGGSESSHGGRRVTFGLDERDQVRVLQGIRLTEDVVNRMKESSRSKRDSQRSPHASNGTAPSSLAEDEGKSKSTGTAGSVDWTHLSVQEQALVQEELLRLAKREKEAASEARERNSINQEKQRTAQLPVDLDAWAVELQGREAELKRKEAFYKEQLTRIERK
ncbi:MC25A protein, partial [Pachyramphus minor]|nr:MC25A protein [Pachyramphus minor]